jgi:hypothetical protein
MLISSLRLEAKALKAYREDDSDSNLDIDYNLNNQYRKKKINDD